MGIDLTTERVMSVDEKGCWKCGKKTGGDIRRHHDGCPYVKELCDKYAACREYVMNAEGSQEWKKEGRKNKKH